MKTGLKKALLTLASIVFGGLTLVFFAVSNFYVGEGEHTIDTTGFDAFENATDFMKAMLVITCIFVGLVVLFGIVKLLTDGNIISNKTVAKIVNFIFTISVLGLVVSAVLYCISVGVMVKDNTIDWGSFGDWIGVGDTKLVKPTVWALVLMSVMSGLSCITGLLSLAGKSGKKRK